MDSEARSLSRPVNRGTFVKITAVCGLALTAGARFLRQLSSENNSATLSETRFLMGTLVNLTVLFPPGMQDQSVLNLTFEQMEQHIALYDHRLSSSPVAQLNREGIILDPPQALKDVMNNALHIAKLTGGAFDPTIKPVLDAFTQGLSVDEKQRTLVGWEHILLEDNRICFSNPGMQITLDGIAKGAVIDAGTAALKAFGCSSVLVEAGGDLLASSNQADNHTWNIGIRHPRGSVTDMLLVVHIRNMAAATSGDYQHSFSADFSHNHIIDPRRCNSPAELASVSVLAQTAMEADALSTAVMVLGVESGLSLVEQLPDIEAVLVRKNLDVYTTSGFPDHQS